MSQMKLVKLPYDEVQSSHGFPGLIDWKLNFKIKEATPEVNYVGPRIPPEVWNQVLSFFKWCYDTTKSECQVRLYVNIKTNTWAAWAYPQEARSYMTAKEVDTDEAKKQREAFKAQDGWEYFGTVHHHCSGGAFQSHTDEENEKSQDGLHITIGKMDQDNHDMHVRVYLKRACFEPDMSIFWDVGDYVVDNIPSKFWDEIARFQMCKKSEVAFPDQWKANLIDMTPKQAAISTTGEAKGFFGPGSNGNAGTSGYVSRGNIWQLGVVQRCQGASEEIITEAIRTGISLDDLFRAMRFMGLDEAAELILEKMKEYRIEDFKDMFRWFPDENQLINAELQEDEAVQKGKRRGKKHGKATTKQVVGGESPDPSTHVWDPHAAKWVKRVDASDNHDQMGGWPDGGYNYLD